MANSKNCDPVPLFRPGVRHKSGISKGQQVEWRNSKPKVIRCYTRRRHPRSRWVKDEAYDENSSN
ncbi:MAG: hypothetical protein R3A47_06110 [Polyangiales bacterium]